LTFTGYTAIIILIHKLVTVNSKNGGYKMNFLCIDIVNSYWYTYNKPYKDPLIDPQWLAKLSAKWNINPLPVPTKSDIEALIELRSCLINMFSRIVNEEKLTEADLQLINGYMKNASFYRQLQVEKDNYSLHNIPVVNSWSWFIAEAATSFARLFSTGTYENLKTCQNPECKWYFIDDSKSRNRKWCDETCSTRMKVRRFRQKQKQENPT
jgi:predicted RNA-binding Zn ribbon-like protein